MRVLRVVLAAAILMLMAVGPVAAGVPVGDADVSVTKSGSPNPVLAGANITYTIVVQNAGPNDAIGVVWTDTVPTGTTFVSLTDLSGAWTLVTPPVGGTGAVTGSMGILSVAAGPQVFTLIVQVDAGLANGSLVNNVVNVASDDDPNQINNSFIAIIEVGVAATPVPSVPDAAMPEPTGPSPALPVGVLAALLLVGLMTTAVLRGRASRA
jgi:uncharacterized repeat protein (TIGR01451 family)